MNPRIPTFALLASVATSGLHAQTQDSDFTIINAVERALAVHPTVQAAGASQQQAAASVGEFTSARLPSLSLDGALLHYDKPMLALPIHGLDATAFQFDQTLIQAQGLQRMCTQFLQESIFDSPSSSLYSTCLQARRGGRSRLRCKPQP